MICPFCKQHHDNEGDRYGCPWCHGEGLDDNTTDEDTNMSRYNYELDVADEFIAAALEQGLRVFKSWSGTYGLITDAEGERVVSWSVNFCHVRLSGNYKTSAPHKTGTGWEIGEWADGSDLRKILATEAPGWALRGAVCRITTLAEHLGKYQQSSKYTEVTEEQTA